MRHFQRRLRSSAEQAQWKEVPFIGWSYVALEYNASRVDNDRMRHPRTMVPETLDQRHDPNSDRMRFPYPFTGQANTEVLVPRSAIVQGEAWVKARIEGLFRYYETPQPGESLEIPDYQFDAKLFQPEK